LNKEELFREILVGRNSLYLTNTSVEMEDECDWLSWVLWEWGKSVFQYLSSLIQIKEKAKGNCPNGKGSPVPPPEKSW